MWGAHAVRAHQPTFGPTLLSPPLGPDPLNDRNPAGPAGGSCLELAGRWVGRREGTRWLAGTGFCGTPKVAGPGKMCSRGPEDRKVGHFPREREQSPGIPGREKTKTLREFAL